MPTEPPRLVPVDTKPPQRGPSPVAEASAVPPSAALAPEPVSGPTAEPELDAASPQPSPQRLHRKPAGPPPDVPLARMPGTNQLRAGTKWDAQRGAWVRTHAFEIPARRGQVVAFYRKALEDAALSVTEVAGAPDQDGAVPVYLKGRRTGEHAHVTVRQDVDELKTRVRVIWRIFVEGGA